MRDEVHDEDLSTWSKPTRRADLRGKVRALRHALAGYTIARYSIGARDNEQDNYR